MLSSLELSSYKLNKQCSIKTRTTLPPSVGPDPLYSSKTGSEIQNTILAPILMSNLLFRHAILDTSTDFSLK